MIKLIKSISMILTICFIFFNLYGCGYILRASKFEAEFAPLRDLSPEEFNAVNPNEIEVITGVTPIEKEYIELGYITFDEGHVSPLVTKFKTTKDFIELFKIEASKHGADAVIKFNITGEHPARKITGIAIKYKK